MDSLLVTLEAELPAVYRLLQCAGVRLDEASTEIYETFIFWFTHKKGVIKRGWNVRVVKEAGLRSAAVKARGFDPHFHQR